MGTKTATNQERLIQALDKMGMLQKRILIIRLYCLVALHKVRQIPRVIFTPSGIIIDRRKSRRFHWPERRLVEQLRWKLRLWLDDDKNPTQP